MLDYDSPGLKLLSSIRSTGSEEKQRKTNWTAEVMAAYILQLHILYVEAFFSTVGKPFWPCKAVNDFCDQVNPVVEEAIAKSEAEAKRVKKRSS